MYRHHAPVVFPGLRLELGDRVSRGATRLTYPPDAIGYPAFFHICPRYI